MSLLTQSLLPWTSGMVVFGAYDGATTPSISTTLDRPFVCEESGCGRRFNRKFTLSEHKKTHTGEKPYVCPLIECSRRFSTSGNLARHKRLHASLKPFECDINGCKRSFPNQEKLNHHIKIHIGRRTHMCRVSGCTKTFSTAGNLTRHFKNRHPELIQNAQLSYQYVRTGSSAMPSPQHRSITSTDHLHAPSPHMIPSAEPSSKLESIPTIYSPDSVELYDEFSAFQASCEPLVQSFIMRPRAMDLEPAVNDSSMSVLDEVIEFELTENIGVK